MLVRRGARMMRVMSLAGRLRAWWRGADDTAGFPAVWGPAPETFAVRRLYERYGREIYARAAADPAFSEAIDCPCP